MDVHFVDFITLGYGSTARKPLKICFIAVETAKGQVQED